MKQLQPQLKTLLTIMAKKYKQGTTCAQCIAAHLYRHNTYDPILRESKKRPLPSSDLSGNIYEVDVASRPGCERFDEAKVPNVVHDYALKERVSA